LFFRVVNHDLCRKHILGFRDFKECVEREGALIENKYETDVMMSILEKRMALGAVDFSTV
jgi:hypothetical protein